MPVLNTSFMTCSEWFTHSLTCNLFSWIIWCSHIKRTSSSFGSISTQYSGSFSSASSSATPRFGRPSTKMPSNRGLVSIADYYGPSRLSWSNRRIIFWAFRWCCWSFQLRDLPIATVSFVLISTASIVQSTFCFILPTFSSTDFQYLLSSFHFWTGYWQSCSGRRITVTSFLSSLIRVPQ